MNLYVHIPFCLSKCGYCALYSEGMARDRVPRDFPELAGREFSLRGGGGQARTIYFGGGTPSMLGAGGIGALADSLAAAGLQRDGGCEWTVELNPAPPLATADIFASLRRVGVNRLSFGVQSLDDGVLAAAGRRHGADDVATALALARESGFDNIGIDLIAGLPGDSGETWRRTLGKAIGFGLRHISVYSLILEPGTALAARAESGEWRPCGDGELLDRLAVAEEMLAAAGFRRYEISNYAMPGFECRHNLACWRGEDYLGIGPGAASRTGRERRTNLRDWRAWRMALASGAPPPAESEETLTAEDDAEERFMFGLRMAEGVSPREFALAHPAAAAGAAGRWAERLRGLAAVGIVRERPGGRFALTPRGREVADSAILRVMD